eukprot:jgi/Mesen1/5501/ME000276S04626
MKGSAVALWRAVSTSPALSRSALPGRFSAPGQLLQGSYFCRPAELRFRCRGQQLGQLWHPPHAYSTLSSPLGASTADTHRGTGGGGSATATQQLTEEAASRSCQVSASPRCLQHVACTQGGVGQGAGARWHCLGPLWQPLLGRAAAPAGASLRAGERGVSNVSRADAVLARLSVGPPKPHKPPNPPASSTDHQRGGQDSSKGEGARGPHIGGRETKFSGREGPRQDQNRPAQLPPGLECVGAICRALEGVPLAAGAADGRHAAPNDALLDDALRPWAHLMSKHVLTAVLREQRSAPSAGLALFRWAQAQPGFLPPSLHAFTALIGNFAQNKDFAQIDVLLTEMQLAGPQPNRAAQLALLNAYVDAGRWDDVESVCNLLKAKGLPMDHYACNNLLKACIRAGRYQQGIAAFRSFAAAGGVPHVVLYNRLILLHISCGELEEAQAVLTEMKAGGCPPDVYAYTILIGALGRAGRAGDAVRTFEEMRREGAEPGLVTFDAIVGACAAGGMCEEAVRFADEMRRRGLAIRPGLRASLLAMSRRTATAGEAQEWTDRIALSSSNSTWTDVHAKAGSYAHRALVAPGGTPDRFVFDHLIWLHGKRGRLRQAWETLAEMRSRGFSPGTVTYTILIAAFGKAREAATALRLFDEMVQEGVPPSHVTYNALIHLCERGGLHAEAERFLEEMQARGHAPDNATWMCMLRLWSMGGRPDRVRALLGRMAEGGCQPDVALYNRLIFHHVRGGDFDEARRVVDELTSRHVASISTYTTLLSAHMQCVGAEARGEVWDLMSRWGPRAHGHLKSLLLPQEEQTSLGAEAADTWAGLEDLLGSVPAETQNSQKSFVSRLVDYLWNARREDLAFRAWALARRKGMYPLDLAAVASRGLPCVTLDYKTMPRTTFLVALKYELSALRRKALMNQPFVAAVEVIGLGLHNRRSILEFLFEEMGLRFSEDPHNSARMTAKGDLLKQWLIGPHAQDALGSHIAAALEGCLALPM